MNTDDLEKALKFQESELSKYSSLSYEILNDMKGRVDVKSPDDLSGYKFARVIEKDEYGGLEVSVFHYWFPDHKVPDYIVKAMGDTDISVGECQMMRWFNINKKGKVEWPSFEHDDEED